MPPPSANQQKVLIAQFVSLTGQTERQATRYLKNAGFKLNEAVDAICIEHPPAVVCKCIPSQWPGPLLPGYTAEYDRQRRRTLSQGYLGHLVLVRGLENVTSKACCAYACIEFATAIMGAMGSLASMTGFVQILRLLFS
ncbi:unnamed protein product [Fusarium graminearum]|uniref:Uncharacterized protein n=1 Tax=Gibberella zeae (strain ATCC MYA-4620 / CBS 123657 / FGSC 9075 / NRRL 31084 / PH-1) TaxID=229533 RepID=I1S5R8_GIBZE|nr:hypothetical protein FGSG_12189 [Fusarium graminearum PH-1]ESU08201.1 hypothetical protein FGSG_12189 [Fusarium graminearum PH-1]EYB32031.1 hypothetical protein FG05_12189 [Fusarium graminearum]CZS78357.1 unnamed protein product [Fusarium graminearum]|eukprot:XP_011318686.1 hypothetical protein FGSG_12189 [Fusarium graminearum PH-1]